MKNTFGKISFIKLFFIFMKLGAIAIGGGFVIFPLLKEEFVTKRHLIEMDDLTDYFAIAQSLPGIVAANFSMLVGYKLYGLKGVFAGIVGITFIPFCLIVLIFSLLGKLFTNSLIAGALWGIGIGIIALILLTAGEIWKHSKRNGFFYTFFLLACVFLLIFNISPVITILVLTILGVLYLLFSKKVSKK